MAMTLESVTFIDAKRNGHKLKTGHLTGNRFDIVVRDVDETQLTGLIEAFETLAETGVPNAFGAQRFGRDAMNAERAASWLRGQSRAPKDPKARRFDFSALQSQIFNEVLAARVADGTFRTPIQGDVLKKTDSGGLFVSDDLETDRARAERGEVVPTGPIYGEKMMHPQGDAFELEERIAAPWLEGIDLVRARKLGEGTRRSMVLQVQEMTAVPGSDPGTLRLRFVLPKGAFATTVLSCGLDVTPPGIQGGKSDDAAES